MLAMFHVIIPLSSHYLFPFPLFLFCSPPLQKTHPLRGS